jgi:MscS family membrane protein
MKQFVSLFPDHSNLFLGFNNGTLLTLFFMLIGVIIIRLLAGALLPKLFKNLGSENEKSFKALIHSGKALGTAMGCGLVLLFLDDLDDPLVVMPAIVETLLPGAIQLIMVIAIVLCAFRFVGVIHSIAVWIDDDGELDGSQKTVVSAAESALRFVILIFGIVFIADALGFDLTTMVAGLGITGLALALAAQDTISNIFGATTVLLDRPFKVGDWIAIDTIEGEVMEIGLRTTLIRTSLDTVVTMPNANLTNTPVENWGKRRFRRWQPIFKLDINSDPPKVSEFCDGVHDLISGHERTMKEENSFARVSALGPDAIDIGCNIYWDISSGKEEREARDGFLIEVMEMAKTFDLRFHDNRRRHN